MGIKEAKPMETLLGRVAYLYNTENNRVPIFIGALGTAHQLLNTVTIKNNSKNFRKRFRIILIYSVLTVGFNSIACHELKCKQK